MVLLSVLTVPLLFMPVLLVHSGYGSIQTKHALQSISTLLQKDFSGGNDEDLFKEWTHLINVV